MIREILRHPLAGYALQMIGLIAIAIGLYAGLKHPRSKNQVQAIKIFHRLQK